MTILFKSADVNGNSISEKYMQNPNICPVMQVGGVHGSAIKNSKKGGQLSGS